jgi:hypothetical protein
VPVDGTLRYPADPVFGGTYIGPPFENP